MKGIEDFIHRRLFDMDRIAENGMMMVNGFHVNKELGRDAKAIRCLLREANRMESLARESGSLNGIGHADNIRRIIASRWSGHRDFNRAWLF